MPTDPIDISASPSTTTPTTALDSMSSNGYEDDKPLGEDGLKSQSRALIEVCDAPKDLVEFAPPSVSSLGFTPIESFPPSPHSHSAPSTHPGIRNAVEYAHDPLEESHRKRRRLSKTRSAPPTLEAASVAELSRYARRASYPPTSHSAHSSSFPYPPSLQSSPTSLTRRSSTHAATTASSPAISRRPSPFESAGSSQRYALEPLPPLSKGDRVGSYELTDRIRFLGPQVPLSQRTSQFWRLNGVHEEQPGSVSALTSSLSTSREVSLFHEEREIVSSNHITRVLHDEQLLYLDVPLSSIEEEELLGSEVRCNLDLCTSGYERKNCVQKPCVSASTSSCQFLFKYIPPANSCKFEIASAKNQKQNSRAFFFVCLFVACLFLRWMGGGWVWLYTQKCSDCSSRRQTGFSLFS